jgi:hypothetical protein
MCSQERNDNSRVDEDDGIRNDNEGRTLYLAAIQAPATLLTASEVVATF